MVESMPATGISNDGRGRIILTTVSLAASATGERPTKVPITTPAIVAISIPITQASSVPNRLFESPPKFFIRAANVEGGEGSAFLFTAPLKLSSSQMTIAATIPPIERAEFPLFFRNRPVPRSLFALVGIAVVTLLLSHLV